MAFTGTLALEVRSDGNDANGGGFNPGNASMATDLAATVANTASPVVTSASYTFVSGDVDAHVFVAAGTNWIPGWYKIASVAAGAATLDAAVGAVALWGTLTQAEGVNTVAGCASVASPTGGTWSVDYSQRAAAIAYTDLVQVTTTTCTSAAKPFGKNHVGNVMKVTGGTGTWTVQWVEIVSVTTVTATVDKTLGGTGGTAGTANLGGRLASIAGAQVLPLVSQMSIWVSGTLTHTAAVTLASLAVEYRNRLVGYGTVRGDGQQATIEVTAAVNGFTNPSGWNLENLNVDGNSTGLVGLSQGSNFGLTYNCRFHHFTGLGVGGAALYWAHVRLEVDHNGAGGLSLTGSGFNIHAHANTTFGIELRLQSYLDFALVRGSLGASGDGITVGSNHTMGIHRVVSYGNARDGFLSTAALSMNIGCGGVGQCIFGGNGRIGLNMSVAPTHKTMAWVDGNAYFTNTSGNIAGISPGSHDVVLAGDPFVDAVNGDFRLADNAAGNALKSMGWPQELPGLPGVRSYDDIGAYRHEDPAAGGGGGGLRLAGHGGLAA